MTGWVPAVEIIPHQGDSVLIDRVREIDAKRLLATMVVRSGTAFSDSSGCLPAWIGPEIIAQAISAKSSLKCLRDKGRPASIGLLLGVRDFRSSVAVFHPGESLEIEVIESLDDGEGRAVFDGQNRLRGEQVAVGILTVFQAEDDSVIQRELNRHA